MEHQVVINEQKVNVSVGDVVSLTTSSIETLTQSYICGENLSSGRAVYLDDDGKVYYAGSNIPQCKNKVIGLTKTSGTAGNLIEVVVFGKADCTDINDAGDYYLALNGHLSKTRATTGIDVRVGRYISSMKILIDIGNYITKI